MRIITALAFVIATHASPALYAQGLPGFDRSSFGKVVLSRTQSALGEINFEVSFGDYNNEFINIYSASSVFRRLGRSVGRLDILTDAGVFPCTAFLVSETHILTGIPHLDRLWAWQVHPRRHPKPFFDLGSLWLLHIDARRCQVGNFGSQRRRIA